MSPLWVVSGPQCGTRWAPLLRPWIYGILSACSLTVETVHSLTAGCSLSRQAASHTTFRLGAAAQKEMTALLEEVSNAAQLCVSQQPQS